MATLQTKWPTLLDFAKASDPDGKISQVAEILTETNEILEDMVYVEGNLLTGHRHTIRTGFPDPTWRKFYGGVQPTKGSTRQVTDSCAMLESYAEVDKALADLNGNSAAFRLIEDYAHIEGMSNFLARGLLYGDETLDPEKFTGLSPRYNLLSADNGENIIDAGGTGTDNTSIWLVCWGPQTVFGIIPKGSTAGLKMEDKGQVTIENVDGLGGRMEGYRTHYRMDVGLTVRDWRYVVRIANIDKSALTDDASSGANLVDLMVKATEQVPNLTVGRPVFYMSRGTRTKLRMQIKAAYKSATMTAENVGGKRVVMFDEIPVKRVDVLSVDEARVV